MEDVYKVIFGIIILLAFFLMLKYIGIFFKTHDFSDLLIAGLCLLAIILTPKKYTEE